MRQDAPIRYCQQVLPPLVESPLRLSEKKRVRKSTLSRGKKKMKNHQSPGPPPKVNKRSGVPSKYSATFLGGAHHVPDQGLRTKRPMSAHLQHSHTLHPPLKPLHHFSSLSELLDVPKRKDI